MLHSVLKLAHQNVRTLEQLVKAVYDAIPAAYHRNLIYARNLNDNADGQNLNNWSIKFNTKDGSQSPFGLMFRSEMRGEKALGYSIIINTNLFDQPYYDAINDPVMRLMEEYRFSNI